MLRISYIRKHPLYISSYQRLQELEQERIFCCHQMNHLLDTARIAYILSLERGIGISKEVRQKRTVTGVLKKRIRRLEYDNWQKRI